MGTDVIEVVICVHGVKTICGGFVVWIFTFDIHHRQWLSQMRRNIPMKSMEELVWF